VSLAAMSKIAFATRAGLGPKSGSDMPRRRGTRCSGRYCRRASGFALEGDANASETPMTM
jgi:hypothetical protein